MEGWTRFVLRHRRVVLASWLAVLLLGVVASSRLAPLLSNTFSVPGTESDHVRSVLEQHFGDRPDGSFTVVFRVPSSRDPVLLERLQRAVDNAAPVVRTARPTRLNVAGPHVVFGDIVSTLSVADAKAYTEPLLRALGTPAGVEHTYVTGAGPIQHDLDPIFNQDLRSGELELAIPIALVVLLAVFGLSGR